MAFYVCFETPGYVVTIHRTTCERCRDGRFQPEDFASHLSWSGPLADYQAALEHVRVTYAFFGKAANCPFCLADKEAA